MQFLKKIYNKYLKDISFFASISFLLNHVIIPYFCGRRPCRYKNPTWSTNSDSPKKTLCGLKIAVVCDNMTWQNFQGECETIFLTPKNWYAEMEQTHPDLFFCESAWSGIESYPKSWDYGVFHNRKLLVENRRVLLNIIRYCKKAGIPTVFWNKEDPLSFYDEVSNFGDTAMLFDHIFTTAKECVPLYKQRGHKSVHTMMFGFSPRLFSPLPFSGNGSTALFHGSWYANHRERCRDMCTIFDMVLERGLKLKIYDRNSGTDDANRIFPEKYQPYIHESVSYHDIRDTMSDARFVININTVKESRTMFARRVFETMACGRVVISNQSVGMGELFGDRVWFVDKPFDIFKIDEIVAANINEVFRCHTWRYRIELMLKDIGFSPQA